MRTLMLKTLAAAVLGVALAAGACGAAAELAAYGSTFQPNQWTRLNQSDLQRTDAPLVYVPALKRFMVLGGSVSWPEYPKPHPFDEVALDPASGRWENWIPASKDWGPRFGDCQPPRWKSES
jgi:hypothetical protein